MRLIKSTWISFTVWVLAALFNAMIMGTGLYFLSTECRDWPSSLLLSFVFTMIFSVPGVFIFWLILLFNWNKDTLFRSLLKTGMIASIVSLVLIYKVPLGVAKATTPFLSLFILIATIASIMMHHTTILSIHPKNLADHV